MGSCKYRGKCIFVVIHHGGLPVLAARPGGEVHGAEDGDDELHPGPVIPGLHLEAAPEVTRRRPRPSEVSLDCEQAWVMTSSGWSDITHNCDDFYAGGIIRNIFVQFVPAQWQITIEGREVCNVYICKPCPPRHVIKYRKMILFSFKSKLHHCC